jgi:hypothetical protein
MDWLNILLTPVITAALVTALAFLARTWVTSRVQETFEIFKRRITWEERRKQQAVEVANLFSLWVQGSFDKSKDPNVILFEVQKKYWELVLWLDALILRAVSQPLASKNGTHFDALISVRRFLLGANDPFTAEEIVRWTPIPTDHKV